MGWPVILVLVLVISAWLWKSVRKAKKFPPGPPRLPIVGGLPFLVSGRETFLKDVLRAVSKYGKVFGFYISDTKCIVVSEYELLKELFKKEELASRPPFEPFNESRPGYKFPGLNGRPPGIIIADGRFWRDQRKFALRHLGDLGFNKSSLEPILSLEVEKLIDHLKKKSGQDLDLSQMMNISILNSLWYIMAGETMALDDPKLMKLLDLVNSFLREVNFVSPLPVMLPWPQLAKLPVLRDWSSYTTISKTFKTIERHFRAYVTKHQETRSGSSASRDFIDAYLNRVEAEEDPTSSFHREWGVDNLVNVGIELFVAGMETTAGALVWVFLYMAKYPKIQQRVQDEIDKVLDSDRRLPTLSDRESMHFTNAVIHESLRISAQTYFAIPRYSTSQIEVEASKLGAYDACTIPEGSHVIPNLWGILRDPGYWDDPDTFKPERFLHGKQQEFRQDERVLAFGTGSRVCPGKALAEQELFLFFTGIMKTFRVVPAPEMGPLPGIGLYDVPTPGPLRMAPKYFVRMVTR